MNLFVKFSTDCYSMTESTTISSLLNILCDFRVFCHDSVARPSSDLLDLSILRDVEIPHLAASWRNPNGGLND